VVSSTPTRPWPVARRPYYCLGATHDGNRRTALEAIACQHLSVARVADGLAVSWNTANNALLAEGQRVLIEDPGRFDEVR
jgi:hypothetical protein